MWLSIYASQLSNSAVKDSDGFMVKREVFVAHLTVFFPGKRDGHMSAQ